MGARNRFGSLAAGKGLLSRVHNRFSILIRVRRLARVAAGETFVELFRHSPKKFHRTLRFTLLRQRSRRDWSAACRLIPH